MTANIFLFFTLIVQIGAIYQIGYYDCNQPNNVIKTDAVSSCSNIQHEIAKPVMKAILQKSPVQRTKGFSCTVRRSMFQYTCGAWSHLKTAAVPRLLQHKLLGPTRCRSIIEAGRYQPHPRSAGVPFTLNEEGVVKVEEVGTLKHTTERVVCRGEAYHDGPVEYANGVVLASYHFLFKTEEYIIKGQEIESVTDHVKLPCKPTSGFCNTAASTHIWDTQSADCPLEKIRTASLTPVDTFYIDQGRQMVINTTTVQQIHSCEFPIVFTTLPDVYIAEVGDTMHLPIVHPEDVKLEIEITSRDNYLLYKIYQQEDTLLGRVSKMTCDAETTSSKTPVRIKDEIFALRRGDTLYSFQCKKLVGEIVEKPSCYQDIPINDDFYVDPVTKLKKRYSSQVSCSSRFPLTVRTESGHWISIDPTIRKVPAPEQHFVSNPHHRLELVTEFAVYTQQEVESWEEILSFPHYQSAVLHKISYGSCLSDASCLSAEDPTHPHYSLDNLLSEVENQVDVFSQIRKWVEKKGAILSFLVIIYVLARILITATVLTIHAATLGVMSTLQALRNMIDPRPVALVKQRKRMKRARQQQESKEDLNLIQLPKADPDTN